MAFLRCEACGAKALAAASQCPRCRHPFELRDARGERVRLRTCSGCGFLHRVDKPCASCGERAPTVAIPSANVWVPLAAAVLLLVGGGAWWLWGPRDTASGMSSEVAEDTSVTGRTIADARDATPSVDPSLAMTDSAFSPGAVARVPTMNTPTPSSSSSSATVRKLRAEPLAKDPAPSMAVATANVQWQRARATTWVNVRKGATRDAEIVGSVRPDVTVELGEVRGGWRAIRSGAVKGWVDPTLFIADSTASRP